MTKLNQTIRKWRYRRFVCGSDCQCHHVGADNGHRVSRGPTQEHNFQLEVRKTGALIGHIRCDAKGCYQYYRGPLNLIIYEFEDDDLERMKQRIASREESAPLTY